MTGQATLTGISTASEVDADLRARGADYTPRPVARECLIPVLSKIILRASEDLYDEPFEVLDVCAGPGCWTAALLELWLRNWPREWLRITAVELDARDYPDLKRKADRVLIGDWTLALDRRYHLAIGNPAFDLLRAPDATHLGMNSGLPGHYVRIMDHVYDVARSMPAQLLAHCDAVALLHRQQAWSKDGPGVAVRRVYPPAFSWDIPGSLRFRAPGSRNPETGKLYGADQHNYSVSLWLPGHTGPTQVELLRDLSPAERRWTVRPGTEP